MPTLRLISTTLAALAAVAYSATIDVVVGGPGILKYNPSSVNANVGDVVRFTFQQKNHTATQSTLANPCVHSPNGFDSGFIPVADTVTSGFPVAELQIKNTDPIWVYCRQANHCQQGMVFAVNPGDKFPAFLAAATGGSTSSTPSTATTGGSSITTATTPASTATAPTPSALSQHKIVVGGPGQLTFSPSNITAQVGDTIVFEFHQKNHTATASSFNAPCRPLSQTSTTGQLGFDSGFFPVADDATVFPTFSVTVNDTNPIWVYCRQSTHCGQGMVFSANAVEGGSKSFEAFQALAKQLNGTTTQDSSANLKSATDFRLAAVAIFAGALLL